MVGDRHQRKLGEGAVRDRQVGQVQPAMLGGERAVGDVAEQREMQIVDVEVEDVELAARRRTRSSMTM